MSGVPLIEWQQTISATEAGAAIRAADSQGLIGARRAMMFHDLDALAWRIGRLHASFPPQSLHALAIKANPVVELLRFAVDQGMGLEAASIEEVALALAAGCAPERILFDSPAKTRSEIEQALKSGIILNADNFDELERIDSLLAVHRSSTSLIGLRINPQIGDGSIGMLSVSGKYSKFGVPLGEKREDIIRACRRYPWLRALHIHVGSQGMRAEQLAAAVALVFELREQIHADLGSARIAMIDIGGGLPWRYRDEGTIPSPPSYAATLCGLVPAAFANDVRLATEYGRTLQVGGGFAASRVEYVKNDGGRRSATIHFGADLFVRPVYRPEEWHLRMSVLAPDGNAKTTRLMPQTVVGPLCFGGDILARDLELPVIEEGDWLVVHDVGGYTLGLWSRHCNRGLPRVLGYFRHPWQFQTLLGGESAEDVVRFWSLANA